MKLSLATHIFTIVATAAFSDTGFISVQDGRFIDASGRHVILHGINVIKKSKPYISNHTREDYAQMRLWGFNSIRLGVLWAGLEPECGEYDEEYLKQLDERIQWAKEESIYVMLDMHQDLWGEKAGGDGAPEWATLDDGKPRGPAGAVWSDAYFTSPMIHAAFDNFWANKPGPDDIGIQDRYALAWQHLAKRYANEPAVVGYDLMNEPFIGSQIITAPMLLLPKALPLLKTLGTPSTSSADKDAINIPDLINLMNSTEGRIKIFKQLTDIEVYRSLVDAVAPLFQSFEKEKMAPMYTRVANAIREVDTKHIIFIETCPTANAGVPSALEPLKTANGERDPLQALAPHAYDIVVDTPAAAQADPARLEFIYGRHAQHAAKRNLPTLVGEWGAFYGNPKILPVARICVRELEKSLASDTYWSFTGDIEKTAYFEALNRPYPANVAGIITSYKTDPETRTFQCTWQENPEIKTPTRIYIPALWYPNGIQVKLKPQSNNHTFEPIQPDNKSGHLIIPTSKKTTERHITIHPAEKQHL